jgi:hypothetical protein
MDRWRGARWDAIRSPSSGVGRALNPLEYFAIIIVPSVVLILGLVVWLVLG